jgi:hypothetical protein
MNTIEVKAEIQKVLNTVPDDVLETVLEYLRIVALNDKNKVELSQNLQKILSEDKELLEKLAQ